MRAAAAGISASVESQVVTRSLDKMLRDPIGDAARRERRALLGVSALAIMIWHTGLLPTKIESVGIELTAGHRTAFLKLLFAVVVYFFATFAIYGLHDSLSYSQTVHATREAMRREVGSPDPPPSLWDLREVALRVSGLRLLWDFAVPIAVAAYAGVGLILMILSGAK